MRKIALLISLLPFLAFAQASNAMIYLNRDMEQCFRDSARFYRIGTMVNGLPQGEIKDYYMSGKLYMMGAYNFNYEPEGFFYFYHENGQRKERGHYVKDEYRVQKMWDEYGKAIVRHGKGTVKETYENGDIKWEGSYNHGLRDGVWNFYHRGGMKAETGEYKSGVYYVNNAWDKKGKIIIENGKGKYVQYYSNGVIKCKGEYADGLKTGKWIWNFSNGKVERTGVYEAGLEVGTHVLTYNTGNPRIKSTYKEGMLHGVYLYYHTNGRIRYSAEFQNGEITGDLRQFDESGNRVPGYDNNDGPHWQSFNTRIIKNKW